MHKQELLFSCGRREDRWASSREGGGERELKSACFAFYFFFFLKDEEEEEKKKCLYGSSTYLEETRPVKVYHACFGYEPIVSPSPLFLFFLA